MTELSAVMQRSWMVFHRLCIVAIAIAFVFPQFVSAQTYPTKPIRILLPYSPGGSGDYFTRQAAETASKILGQSLIVEPKLGAGGSLAAEMLAKSAPADGYMASMIAAGVMTINPHIYKKMIYDPEKDIAPVTIGVRMPLAVIVNKSLPITNIKELIAYAKANPGKLTFGSAGIGSSQHLAGELFKASTGVDLLHVPYKGGASAANDLLGGHLALQFVHLPSFISLNVSGKIRILAITSAERNSLVPDVPTVAEAGVSGYEYSDWFGFVMPVGAPPEVFEKLRGALVKGIQENREAFESHGMVVVASDPEEMSKTVREESRKWSELLQAANVAPQ
jgi:tripartite-type tricarboxylate transporter receptor subunit TctC